MFTVLVLGLKHILPSFVFGFGNSYNSHVGRACSVYMPDVSSDIMSLSD